VFVLSTLEAAVNSRQEAVRQSDGLLLAGFRSRLFIARLAGPASELSTCALLLLLVLTPLKCEASFRNCMASMD